MLQRMHYGSKIHLKQEKKKKKKGAIRCIKGDVRFGIKFKKCQNFKLRDFLIVFLVNLLENLTDPSLSTLV